MSEPPTRPAPFPAARGPHLPDALTRRSPWFYGFLIVALVNGWRLVVAPSLIVQPELVFYLLVSVVPSIVGPLLGAVLFGRHRDAWRSMPLLAFGLVLVASGELLNSFDQIIGSFLDSLTPLGAPPTSPAHTAYAVFTGLLGVFAILYVAAGLSSARRMPRVGAERPLMVWLVALGVIAAIVSVTSVFALGLEATPILVLQLGLGVVLSLASTVAWAYLAAVTIGGSLAAEVPRRAWQLAALAVALLIAATLINTGASAANLGDPGLVVTIAGVASMAGWLIFLVAFILGLPTPGTPAGDATDDRPAATPRGSAGGRGPHRPARSRRTGRA